MHDTEIKSSGILNGFISVTRDGKGSTQAKL